MKKILLIMLATFMSVTYANAEELNINVSNNNFEDFYNIYKDDFRLYDYYMNIFNSQTEYEYYVIDFYSHGDNYFYNTHLYLFNSTSYIVNTYNNSFNISVSFPHIVYGYDVLGNDDYGPYEHQSFKFSIGDGAYQLIDTNFNFILNGATYSINGLHDSTLKINSGDKIPSLKDLSNETIRNSYINGEGNYTEVNLDNYEYIILNLKSYNTSTSFSSNLKVKGMIGITPVYEFGTVEKQEITDRCNINYDDYTDYRLYVLKEDLINNAVYIIKSCKDGSSFKYNSSIFDITFVTDDNVNDPVITVGGVEYHTIPFNQLSNSANKNEEENFVPGESESFNPIESLNDYISSFWNSLTTFMSLVTKFFNTLPIEIRAVTITFFTTACTLGLLKILKR